MPTGPTISNQGPGGPALAPYSLSKKLPNAPGLGQEANLLIIGETIQTFQILSRLGQTFQYSPPHEIRDGNSKGRGRGQEIYPPTLSPNWVRRCPSEKVRILISSRPLHWIPLGAAGASLWRSRVQVPCWATKVQT